MTALVLDAGALIALECNARDAWAMLRVATDRRDIVVVPTGAIAQAWRGGARQALLARALSHCHEVALDGTVARAAGLLCAESGTVDVVDASVAIVADAATRNGPVVVLTSDARDLDRLFEALRSEASTVRV